VLRLPRLLAAIGLLLAPATIARADFFSTSPGPLTQPHANIDGKDHCQDCHTGARDVTVEKCLKCHQPIAERQRERKGVHASPKALGKQCELCHTDHKGRNKDILGFASFGGIERFDHNALTSFALEGKHQTTKCNDCHKEKTQSGTRTYLKSPTACAACHNNPHGDLRENMRRCERCHDAKTWHMVENAQFDHDRDTRYPLEKKHEPVKCAACHFTTRSGAPPNSKTTVPPTNAAGYQKLTFRWPTWGFDCTPCHDNVHGTSLFGTKACKLCHSAKVEFTRINFDHNRRTRFPLDGVHADPKKAPCYSCHPKEQKAKPDRKCDTCHKDVHQARFAKVSNGNDCAVCHTAANWPTDLKFDHSMHTKFPLTGAHANADCRACHRGKGDADWENVSSLISGKGKTQKVACMGCHQHENVHKKQYPNERCLECHKMAGVVETKPRAINEFHGPNSRFPLIEGHKGVACDKCHPGNVFKENTPLQCGPACHPDELHKGTLGKDCLSCHTGGKWEARLFDHDTKTKWPLVGNHRDVLCEGCHPRRDFANNRGKSTTCYNCHSKDDAHAGQLGRRCENCHSPDGKVSFDHNNPDDSDWPLEGKHGKVKCNDCHKSIHFKPTPRECGGCHGEPDVHRGQLGTLCGSCHVADDWKLIHTGHDVPTPKFAGAHDRVPCVACHPGGRLLGGTGNLCITCHRNDDIHHNVLGPNCGECHTQRTFAGAHFEHNRVGCELMGVHRMLPCVDCHIGGNFTALASNCYACHAKDKARATAQSQSTPTPTDHTSFTFCAGCHNTIFFGPKSVAQPGGRESVCR
jgi:hypothetical protein